MNSDHKKALSEALQLQLAVIETDVYSHALYENVTRIHKIADEMRPHPRSETLREIAMVTTQHIEKLEQHLLDERVKQLAVPVIVIHGLAFAQLALEKFEGNSEDALEELQEAWSIYDRVAKDRDYNISKFAPFLKSAIQVADNAFNETEEAGVLQ